MRQRQQNVESTPQRAPLNGGDAPDQGELRERAASLLAAADEAISRALSRDSAEFLAQNRQMGGE
jgi:hypothetical protein